MTQELTEPLIIMASVLGIVGCVCGAAMITVWTYCQIKKLLNIPSATIQHQQTFSVSEPAWTKSSVVTFEGGRRKRRSKMKIEPQATEPVSEKVTAKPIPENQTPCENCGELLSPVEAEIKGDKVMLHYHCLACNLDFGSEIPNK